MPLAGSLDLFLLMTGFVAGSIMLSIIIWALILLVTGIMGRMSMPSILIILITFLGVSTVGYVGALGAVPIFLWASWYLTTSILNWINSMR